jgi:glycosyltransferase involved in cell wall biosynthesis
MNILIYFPGVNRGYGGVFQYTHALLKTLSQDDHNKYFLCTERNNEIDSLILNQKNFQFIQSKEADESIWSKVWIVSVRLFLRILKRAGLKVNYNPLTSLDRVCRRHKIDVLHSPTQSIPLVRVPKIVTLHDVQELHYPEFFTSTERMWRAINYKESIDNADTVIVSYDHIKQDIVRFFEKPEKQVHVVLMEMNNLWFEKFIDKSELADVTRYSESKAFVLYPAATWPHKNHVGLLKAIKALKDNGLEIKLLCTGHLTKHFERVQELVNELDLQSTVSFLGVVPDDVLFSLYKNTIGIVIPTIYEAGSFPLMEAMLLRIPVICSNVTSLPETIGNSEYVFNPNDYHSIAERLEKLVSSKEFRAENVRNSEKQSRRLINTGALNKLGTIYSTILNATER